jgi:hypothetical protein
MNWLWRRYALMDEAGGDGGAGGGGVGAAAAAGTADGGAAAAAGGAAAGGSALAAGGDGGGAAAAATGANFDWLPEKYRVAGADGAIDVAASAQKLAGGYGELSKRFGDGGAAPKAPEEYAVVVPDTLKEAMGDLNNDDMFKQFRSEMHGLGLSQKQFDGVMSKYFQLVPELVAGGVAFNTESATADLRKAWTDDGTYTKNVQLAYRAGDSIAKAAGMSFNDLEKAGLANNPTFIKLMAAIGPEFGEDVPVTGGQATGFASESEIQKMLSSEANLNPKHADHKATRARVDAYYARKYGNAPIA